MAKVFTITEGLENMGAMKTGGQGSVYKGRRIGEIITAIKLLPTPIYSESPDDKNYSDFQNEVQKLKKVNEEPNPHVVTILSSGITDTGNFPFIEMEYIDGPDLEDLLKPPHERVFSVKEVLKVSNQLSDALAHCHRLNVKHGDIKSNNVKFNKNTGNYILLDFGLSAMSDEQRRTSLRHAGAIEFMAPEQNEGQMLLQTDVYSFGVIIYELISGTVPFPLHDKGETARNAVRLSHMETPPPDMMKLRRQSLPVTSWDDAKKTHEMQVPEWLINMVYKCLEKKPADRFVSGVELHEYIVLNSTLAAKKDEAIVVKFEAAQQQNQLLLQERQQLQTRLVQYKERFLNKEKDLDELKAIIDRKDHEIKNLRQGQPAGAVQGQNGVSKSLFLAVLILAIALGGYAAYTVFSGGKADSAKYAGSTQANTDSSTNVNNESTVSSEQNTLPNEDELITEKEKKEAEVRKQIIVPASRKDSVTNTGTSAKPNPANEEEETTTDLPNTEEPKTEQLNTEPPKADQPENTQNNPRPAANKVGLYTVDSKAYFHNEPDETTRREAFLNKWNNAVLAALDDKNGFIYVVYTNKEGQTSKGWIRKKDITRINK